MSEKLPYEENLSQQWNDLPLPDENMAWDDMRRRLDEEDDDKVIAWWRRGCLPWIIGSLLVIAIGWWIFQPQKWFDKNESSEPTNVMKNESHGLESSPSTQNFPSDSLHEQSKKELKDDTDSAFTPRDAKQKNLGHDNTNEITTGETVSFQTHKGGSRKRKENNSSTSWDSSRVSSKSESKNTIVISESGKIAQPKPKDSVSENVNDQLVITTEPANVSGSKTKTDSANTGTMEIIGNSTDSTKNETLTPQNDSLKTVKPNTTDKKKDNPVKKDMFFIAGLAIQQQVPVDSQKASPYNSLGRKGTVMDYLPSAYFRLTKDRKWFIQLELKYGAPQYSKQFLYSEKAAMDSMSGDLVTTRLSLRKTYYHQIPLGFHVYVLKNWSLGAGITWNRFSSAVANQDILRRRPGTIVDSLSSRDIVKVKADSIFAKSYFQGMLETQFQWKRFSLGARYSMGLKPFIKFTLPGGVQQEQRNQSLQIFLRYELFRKKLNKD